MPEQNTARLDPQATTDPQETIDAEIAQIQTDYRASVEADASKEETQPRLNYPPYRSSLLRHPTKDLHHTDRRPLSCTPQLLVTATYTFWNRI